MTDRKNRPEIEIPVAVREAIATYLARDASNSSGDKVMAAREAIAAWLREARQTRSLKDLYEASGINPMDTAVWKRRFAISLGGEKYGNKDKKPAHPLESKKIYLQKYFTADAPVEPVPTPVEKKAPSRFSVRVIEMSGDDDTVKAAIEGLRDFLHTRSN